MFGNSLEVDTIDGDKATIDVVPGSQSRDKITVKNKVGIVLMLGVLCFK
jgi:hypothetical protein